MRAAGRTPTADVVGTTMGGGYAERRGRVQEYFDRTAAGA